MAIVKVARRMMPSDATIIQDAKEGFRVVLDADIASFFVSFRQACMKLEGVKR